MNVLWECDKEFGYEIVMKMMRCEVCDSRFAISKTLIVQSRNSGGTLYCPRGHKHKYTKPVVGPESKPANVITQEPTKK